MDALAEAEFERYFRARRAVCLMCGDRHRADDHTQAAFVALHRHWCRVRDKRAALRAALGGSLDDLRPAG